MCLFVSENVYLKYFIKMFVAVTGSKIFYLKFGTGKGIAYFYI